MKIILSIFILAFHLALLRAAPKSNTLAITNVTVIDCTGSEPKSRMTVVIEGNRIADLGSTEQLKVPAGAQTLDGSGRFLIPGLWDMHVHLSKSGENTLPLFPAYGITSVRDMGGDFNLLSKWRSEIAAGHRIGPRIKLSGPILEASTNVERMKREATIEPVDRFRLGVSGPEAAEEAVNRLASMGVDFLKIRSVSSLETYRALAAAAKKHHLDLVGHLVATPEQTIEAGQRSIEHGFYPPLSIRSADERRQLFQRMAERKIAVTPTLVVGEALLTPYERTRILVDDSQGKNDPRRKYLSGYIIEDWKEQAEENKQPWPGLKPFLEQRLIDMREMFQAGVRILPGTDVGVLLIWPGSSLHEELDLLVRQIHLTPMQALMSATLFSAEFLGMQDSLGTIEKGKLADLVLLEANPLEQITNTQKIRAILSNGTLFDQSELQIMLSDVEHGANSTK